MSFKLLLISLLLSFLGFLDATYLTIVHYKNIIPPCSIAHGCETVLTSSYATIGPIPIALIGSIYFVSLIIILILIYQNKNSFFIMVITFLTSIALLISGGLVYIQAAILHAYCQYCLASELINVLLFVTVIFNYFKNKKDSKL